MGLGCVIAGAVLMGRGRCRIAGPVACIRLGAEPIERQWLEGAWMEITSSL